MEVRLYADKRKGSDTSYKWQRRKRVEMRLERVAFLCYNLHIRCIKKLREKSLFRVGVVE